MTRWWNTSLNNLDYLILLQGNEVVEKLRNLVKQWIKSVSLGRMLPKIAESVGGTVRTFGSFQLGVAGRGAKIDTICLAPNSICRSDYFKGFYELLKRQPAVTEARAVEDALVPLIKMKYEGIEVDMLFARLSLNEVSDDVDLRDENIILKSMDKKCIRSLNECKVTDEILRQVPNIETFKLALRALNLWAKRHGVDNSILGYLGGASWALLVAKACKLYPNDNASTIVERFFFMFSRWSWPCPVYLKLPLDAKLDLKVWDPRVNPQDKRHPMPVITPTYPQKNSTSTVSETTKDLLIEAFRKSLKITQSIKEEQGSWKPLFTPQNFFRKFRHYIMVVASAESSEDLPKWQDFVETNIRPLILALEKNSVIKMAHVHPTPFRTHSEKYVNEPHVAWFIGANFILGKAPTDLAFEFKKFSEKVCVKSTYNKLYKDGLNVVFKYVSRKKLSHCLSKRILGQQRSSNSLSAITKQLKILQIQQEQPQQQLVYDDEKQINSNCFTDLKREIKVEENEVGRGALERLDEVEEEEDTTSCLLFEDKMEVETCCLLERQIEIPLEYHGVKRKRDDDVSLRNDDYNPTKRLKLNNGAPLRLYYTSS